MDDVVIADGFRFGGDRDIVRAEDPLPRHVAAASHMRSQIVVEPMDVKVRHKGELTKVCSM
jgi:hypothetical protein